MAASTQQANTPSDRVTPPDSPDGSQKSFQRDLVTIAVGVKGNKFRPHKEYQVHKDLLTAASPFFASALNGTFAEALERHVRLPEEKPEIFEWFLRWLYTGALTKEHSWTTLSHSRSRYHESLRSLSVRPLPNIHLDRELHNSAGSPKYFLLLDLYALSDRLSATGLSNHILSTMARLSEQTNTVPTPSDTWILYDPNTIRDSSPARALVLDLFAYKKTDKLLETHRDHWHPAFLRALVVKLKRPGPDALERHSLVAWQPRGHRDMRACDACRAVFVPGESSGDWCCRCDKAFCYECLRRHVVEPGFGLPHDPSGCKPWYGRGMCLRYHEHAAGEVCGEGRGF